SIVRMVTAFSPEDWESSSPVTLPRSPYTPISTRQCTAAEHFTLICIVSSPLVNFVLLYYIAKFLVCKYKNGIDMRSTHVYNCYSFKNDNKQFNIYIRRITMSKVFEEVHLKHLTLKNRLVRSATQDPFGGPEGFVSDKQKELYRTIANNN